MGNKALRANTTTSSHIGADVTGTSLPGNKHGLDSFVTGSISHLLDLANLLIKGTLPEVNYDRIIRTTVSSTALTLAFSYNGSVQFYFDATNVYGDYDVSIRNTYGFTLESGMDILLLESGDILLSEG